MTKGQQDLTYILQDDLTHGWQEVAIAEVDRINILVHTRSHSFPGVTNREVCTTEDVYLHLVDLLTLQR